MGFSYDYGYDYYDDFGRDFGGLFDNPAVMDALAVVIGFIAIAVLICGAISIALYIFRSIGLYKLSVNRGMSGGGLAWIPAVGFYRIGSVADDIAARSGSKSYFRHILLAGAITRVIISSVQSSVSLSQISQFFDNPYAFRNYGYSYGYSALFSGLSSLIYLLVLAVYVITIIALNKIYKCYRPASSTSWTVLSVIFPFMQPIFLFVIRNSVPADAWGAPAGYYPESQPQGWTPPSPPPAQYPPYSQQPPSNYGYYAQQGPPQYMPPTHPTHVEPQYQPPAAPNPPEPWEIKDTGFEPPPRAPWENKD